MAATEGVLKSICMYCCDSEIDRRPYHRNCSCALHRSRRSGEAKSGKNCSHGLPKSKSISYPMRKSWSEGCLSLAAAAGTGSSADSSPAGSPAIGPPVTVRSLHRRLSSFDEVEEDQSLGGGGVCFKI